MDFGLMGSDKNGSGEPPPPCAAVKGRGSEQETWRGCKVANFLMRSGDDDECVSGKATMLSFSSSKSVEKEKEIPFLSCGEDKDSSKSICFPLFHSQQKRGPLSAYGFNESSRVVSARLSGPFTPSQWMELEHQALIYKHLVANVPIPSNLLVPLMRSLSPYSLSGLSSGPYSSNWGWGAFHLGYSASNDPEPGRCRRTDGKKWRCSRDAVPDQKYCERHINRGRHRSRKPVEGQTGQAVSGPTATSKVSSISSSVTTSVIPCNGSSNSLGASKHQFSNSQHCVANPSTDHLMNNRTQCISVISPSINVKPQDSTISTEKQHNGFGFLSSDSLINPPQKRPFVNSNSDTLLDFNGQDWTRLSMSIPMAASDFSSSSSSPQQEKPTAAIPLKLSREFEPFQMGLGVSNDISETTQKTSNWRVPLSWGNAMGGPLGEVLNNTYGSSPTGVLQKSTFASLSNSTYSSSGSSPRDDTKKVEGATVVSSLSVPNL